MPIGRFARPADGRTEQRVGQENVGVGASMAPVGVVTLMRADFDAAHWRALPERTARSMTLSVKA
jgi:hypothetical protein